MRAEILEEIGLTKSEIKVYLALLELGSSATGKIVDKSKASSSKIYEILDKLMQKGLVSFIIKKGVKYFEAAPPERIMDYMKEKEEKFSKQKEELKKILPELDLKQKLSKYKSEATIFKGLKGGETAFRYMVNSMKKDDEWVGFVISFTDKRYFDLLTKLHAWRAKKGLKSRIIINEKHKEDGRTREKISHTKVKYVPDQMQIPAIVNVAGNITLLNVMADEITVFMIESKEVADSFRGQFERLWEQRVYSYEGEETIEKAYNILCDSVTSDDEVIIFAAKPESKRSSDFNLGWNERIRKKVKRSRLMYYGETETNIKRAKEIEEVGCETKIIPTKQSLPISTIVAGDTIINTVWKKRPLMFKLEDKTVADSFKENFNLLWGQEVTIRRGIEGMENTWSLMLDELNPGEEYYVLGATWRGQKERVFDYFIDFHKRRQEKGVKAKFLFVSGTEKIVEKHKDSYKKLGEVKFLPQGVYEGLQINLYKNKVLIFVWREKEPIVFSIEDKTVYETFKSYFDSMWGVAED